VSHESPRRRARIIIGVKMVGGSFLKGYTSPLYIERPAPILSTAFNE